MPAVPANIDLVALPMGPSRSASATRVRALDLAEGLEAVVILMHILPRPWLLVVVAVHMIIAASAVVCVIWYVDSIGGAVGAVGGTAGEVGREKIAECACGCCLESVYCGTKFKTKGMREGF